MVVGSIPNAICVLSITLLYITNSGTNPGITCAPLCVSSVNTHYVPSTICVYPQDQGLCGLIAATNIQAKYGQWSCTTAGLTSSTPCKSPVWPGTVCVGSDVVSINVNSIGLIGIVCSTYILIYCIPLIYGKYVCFIHI